MKNYVTKEGYQNMIDDLNKMINVDLREAIKMIEEARDKGDLSENAEYETAKEYHQNVSKKIQNFREKIQISEIIAPVQNGKVNMLSTVKIKNQQGQILDWTLVPENEINIKDGKISFNSPVGSALLGKTLGETVSIKVPAGQLELEILEIE